MKTKTNKVPLVGPRGRKEILKKVEQIAQQDYIRLAVADPIELTAEEKAKIKKHIQQGTIWNVLIEIDDAPCRVLAINEDNKVINVFSSADNDILTISYSED